MRTKQISKNIQYKDAGEEEEKIANLILKITQFHTKASNPGTNTTSFSKRTEIHVAIDNGDNN